MKDAYVDTSLSRLEVIRAVERSNPRRIPLVMTKWWGEGLREQYGVELQRFELYPQDSVPITVQPLNPSALGLSWQIHQDQAKDTGGVLTDWSQLDEFIAKMPDPAQVTWPDSVYADVERARQNDQYVLFGWWRLFFERPWQLRGMENLLVDYYEYPEEIHRLHSALCSLYVGLLQKAAREFQPDGFWTSDDLGNQRQLMMSPEHFRTFLKPYYREIGNACRRLGMHFWLHSCGNNTEILGDLIESGLNVFHPVQKNTMDEAAVAGNYGDKLTFLAGIDVQHILQKGSPEQVRAEVRYLIDTFDGPGGGMCLAAGNGIVAGTPLENIEAFLDEAVRYGAEHRRRGR